MGYSLTQKGYKCYHPPSIFFFLVDVTFNESESYFPIPCLQWENSIEEDKDHDSYFIDPFLINLIDPLKVSDSISITLIDCIDPLKSVRSSIYTFL